MSTAVKRAHARWICRFSVAVAGFALLPLVANAAGSGDQIDVVVDQARLIKLPERVATLVVGNPMIADVTLQAGGMMVVTGKGYGATNFIALDREGTVLVDRVIQVEGPTDKLVTIYRGVDRETYSCTPVCQRRVTLGDGAGYFTSTLEQAGNLSNQAAGNATTAAANSSAPGGAATR
ncbi:pilus assembly protein N-terminal domain-containing protein [Bradyrhizobium prioriisuperbiae]|uniref:pilus assembly protein N-terminal domain-containing protein n=1 Tax=Bradyrhizobium prioriisuperbiae TaxID=2854389 RepID=UPI0028E235B5|nr:pilus assembly protein N-terminal domain-containing protein [Bradyrhizobium prioritasuperba]